jgi:hypothetical protein
MRRIALSVPLALLVSIACAVTAPSALAPETRASPAPTSFGLPKPIPQPITRTSPGAQVAWLRLTERDSGLHSVLAGIDPSGAIVAQLDVDAIGARGIARSADGASLYAFAADRIDVYSALTGKLSRTYRGPASDPIDSAFSPDGRWAALLVAGPQLQLIDLVSGTSQMLPLEHDPKANLPGLSGNVANALWGTLAFATDSAHLYTLTDWGGPARVTSFALGGSSWTRAATAVSGQKLAFPECAGPALALKVVQGGRVLAAFCHVDGAVWLFDLSTLTPAAVLRPSQKNPFWLSPIFTPDGQLLYLHQSPAFGDEMQVVDLAGRRVLGPVPTPTKTGAPGPFAWLMPVVAYAGGVASTVPISPDGLRMYSPTTAGIVVLRVPDLALVTTLAPGLGAGEVWISGDGRTVYSVDGQRLVIASDDGRSVKRIDLPKPNAFFISSEHG